MTDSEQEERKSRSQIKREFLELKELGKQLVALSAGQLRTIPLSQGTREAVLAAKEMTRAALQRQLRHLAHLIEEEDVASIRDGLSGALQPHAEEVATLHEAEHWRDELLAGDDDLLARFIEQHPACDRQHLRQLVRNARKERDLDKPPKSARLLFRYLKGLGSQR
jgi:ribosome-associated protein